MSLDSKHQDIPFVSLVIEGLPLAWKAPFVGSHGAYSPRYNEMKIIRSIIKSQYSKDPVDFPMICDLIFFLPIPKSTSKKRRALMIEGKVRPIGPPDRTNLAKLYEDCLQGIVIMKDSRIVDGRVAKYYAEVPRTLIEIREAL